jgi:hypothetical protein
MLPGVNIKSDAGQTIMMVQGETNNISLDINLLPAALYLMEVITPRSRGVKKFVVMD